MLPWAVCIAGPGRPGPIASKYDSFCNVLCYIAYPWNIGISGCLCNLQSVTREMHGKGHNLYGMRPCMQIRELKTCQLIKMHSRNVLENLII